MAANARTYGPILNKALLAVHSSIDRANSVNDPYYKEGSLIFLANAWELFAKALLIKHGGDTLIYETGSRKERTITAENAVHKLRNLGYMSELQCSPVQQAISLRNEALHTTLPPIPDEILFHLEYYAVRYFRELLDINFKPYPKKLKRQYLSISFGGYVTYAESVKKLIGRARKNRKADEMRLAYLLERGVTFSGSEYMKQADFDKMLLDKKTSRPMYKLKTGEYTRAAEMIVVVPIQAPSGTQADITLSKSQKGAITVNFEKKATDDDYPHLTQDVSAKLGKSLSFAQRMIKDLSIKGNPAYHQRIRSGKKSFVHKYSDTCINYLKQHLAENPAYIPPA